MGAIVKQIWNVAMHVLYQDFLYIINNKTSPRVPKLLYLSVY